MIRFFKKKIKKEDEFIKYVLISLFCTLIFFIIYETLIFLTNGKYLIANGFGYFISFTTQFILDQILFKAKPDKYHKHFIQGVSFIIVRLIGFPIDECLLYFLVEKYGLTYLLGKLFGSLIMFIYNYLTNKFIVFKIK